MRTSETCSEIFSALASAQSGFKVPAKSGKNGRNRPVSTEGDIRDAVRGSLAANKLAVIQSVDIERGAMVTRIVHASGEWFETDYPFAPDTGGGKADVQAVGSGATYARRYSLMQALGTARDDDEDPDGENAAPDKSAAPQRQKREPEPMPEARFSSDVERGRHLAEDIAKADLAGLVKIEQDNNSWFLAISEESPKLLARVKELIAERREALNGFQAPPSGKAGMEPPEHLNGGA